MLAIDAATGREVWHFQRPRTQGLVGNAAGGFNRGVAGSGDRLYMVMDNAHIVALDRASGDLVWETVMADWHQNYNAPSAPLIVGNLVISGTAGGEQGRVDLLPLSISPAEKKCGDSGPSRSAANPARKRGRGQVSNIPAPLLGSPAPTTRRSTRFTGLPAIWPGL